MRRLLELDFMGPEKPEPYWDDIDFGSHYDRDGEPINMRQWGALHQDPEYKILRQEDVGDYWVSTVWIGIDHGLHRVHPDYPLMIFETMVFKGEESDLDCERYSTEAEALAGHERMVEKVRLLEAAT